MAELTLAQESVKRYGKKVSFSGGRFMAQHETCKEKSEPKMYKIQETVKVVKAGSTGIRTGRLDSLAQRERQRKAMKGSKIKTKVDKALQLSGQGATRGKQKSKGTSQVPRGHASESQCHIDVFYAGSNKKWDVPPPAIDPLKTCNIKR